MDQSGSAGGRGASVGRLGGLHGLGGHVVVTGAGSPAGRALVVGLARAGALVVAVADVPATSAPPRTAPPRTPSTRTPSTVVSASGISAGGLTPSDDRGAPGVTGGDLRGGGVCSAVVVDLTTPAVLDAMALPDGLTADLPDGLTAGAPPAAVVHVALDTDLRSALAQQPAARRERAESAARAVVTAAAAAGAERLVLVSSAMVHGARPDAPVPLDDDAPLLAALDDGLVGDLLAVEEVWASAARALPGMRTAVLRPAAVVGPGVDTVVTRSFEVPRLLALRERAPVWQFCHVDDLASAAAVVVGEGLTGAMGVGSEGVLVHEALERSSGLRSVELPARLAHATAERLARLGLLPTPAGDLAYVVHPWAVSAARLRAAGWRSASSNEECLRALLDGVRERRAARGPRLPREAALGAAGAAGAAVAVVATAAVVRQARARRGR